MFLGPAAWAAARALSPEGRGPNASGVDRSWKNKQKKHRAFPEKDSQPRKGGAAMGFGDAWWARERFSWVVFEEPLEESTQEHQQLKMEKKKLPQAGGQSISMGKPSQGEATGLGEAGRGQGVRCGHWTAGPWQGNLRRRTGRHGSQNLAQRKSEDSLKTRVPRAPRPASPEARLCLCRGTVRSQRCVPK